MLYSFKRMIFAIPLLTTISAVHAEPQTNFRLAKANTSNAIGEDVWLYAVPKQLGYFSEEGLNVVLLPAQGLASGQLLVNNGAEVATQLAEGVLKLREQGADVVSFFTVKMNLGYSVAVLPESPVRSLADLVGKNVGFGQTGSGSEFVVREQLRRDDVKGTYNAITLGYGAQVATALKSRQVDAIYYWEALYGLMANQGVILRQLQVPLQDKLAGFQLVTSGNVIKSRSKDLVGFCRAVAKALLFTRTNPRVAVDLFYKEFPAVMTAGKPKEEVLTDGTKILESWLQNAVRGVGANDKMGQQYPERWAETGLTFAASGVLQKGKAIEGSFTNDYISKCYDFDTTPIVEAARKAKSSE